MLTRIPTAFRRPDIRRLLRLPSCFSEQREGFASASILVHDADFPTAALLELLGSGHALDMLGLVFPLSFCAQSMYLYSSNTAQHTYFSLQAAGLGVLGARICAGVFTRLTFVAFAAPLILRALGIAFQQMKTLKRVSYVVLPATTTLSTVVTFIALDTWFFNRSLHNLPLTPFNFLKYNLSPDNLAQHGLHPRWLHLVVNFPMIVGPFLAIQCVGCLREAFWRGPQSADKKIPSADIISRGAYIQTIAPL